MSQPLHLVNEHGEPIRSSCAGCNDLLSTNESLRRTNESLLDEVFSLRKSLEAKKKSKKEADQKARDEYKQRGRVETIFAMYQQILGKPKCILGPARFDAIRRMVDLGYQDEHFELAFFGAQVAAFRSPETGLLHQDIELICRNESKFESFANKGAGAVKARKLAMEADADE
jgi:hypothetical protein